MHRLFTLFFALAVLVVIPFVVWGEGIESWLRAIGPDEWLRNYGAWAWSIGILLLMADLLLPIPATVVMTTLGILYGPLIGGFFSALGSFLAGSLGYGICRWFGQRAALTLLGERDLIRGRQLFAGYGGWLIAFSRWLPVFPEVMTCMAGLVRMPATAFFAALACGSIPFGFTFAMLGHAGADQPLLAIGLSALVPLVLWTLTRQILKPRDA